MPATPRRLEISEKDIQSAGEDRPDSSAYALLEVPADYEAVLTDVSDYDYRDQGKSYGWIWNLEVEGLPFRIYTAFSTNARWKLVETLRAFEPALSAGALEQDPNRFVGKSVGAHLDWQYDPDTLEEGKANYREIKYLFPLPPAEFTGEAAAPDIL